MIRNTICPYCREPMIIAENQPNSRSEEHLVPRIMTTRERKNDKGDFYACRRCNAKKSKVDELLSKIAMAQNPDVDVALEGVKGIHKRIDKKKGARYLSMV